MFFVLGTKFMNTLKGLLSRIIRHRKLFAFFVFLFLVSVPFAHASLTQYYKAVQAEGQNLQKFGAHNSEGFFDFMSGSIVGQCTGDRCPESLKTGAISTTTSMIAGLYANPPASGVTYVADVLQRFNPVQPAYAQTGTGFNALSPILPVWKAFRNFAYAFFAVIFVFIGLAVMFRMKLDPRTTLTIQAAIPRIVVALLLVTFSYAIAGFLVDFLYVMIALVAMIFGGVENFLPTQTIQDQFLNGGFGQVIGKVFAIAGGGVNIGTGLGLGVASLITLGIAAIASPAAWVLALGAGLPLLILLLVILYLIFRLFMELLRAYIMIIVFVVLAPLQISLGVIPGMPGFGSWFKNIMANILVFPAVAFVLLLAQVMVGLSANNLWVAPMVTGSILGIQALPLLIGFGFLLIVHQVPQAIRNLFGLRGLGFALGEAFGGMPPRAGLLGAAQVQMSMMERQGGALAAAAGVGRRLTGIRK